MNMNHFAHMYHQPPVNSCEPQNLQMGHGDGETSPPCARAAVASAAFTWRVTGLAWRTEKGQVQPVHWV